MSRRSRRPDDGASETHGLKRRVGVVIRRELAEIISSDLGDPKVGQVTLTGVDVSPDLKHASVYVNHLTGDEEQSNRSVAALNHAAGFLRRKLSQRLTQRVTPALVFKYDDSIESGMRISQLIDNAVAQAPAEEARTVDSAADDVTIDNSTSDSKTSDSKNSE